MHAMAPIGRRPRIPAELAGRIDELRGDTSFEQYVHGMLEAVLDQDVDPQEILWKLFHGDAVGGDLRKMDSEYDRFRERVRFRRELEDYEGQADLHLEEEDLTPVRRVRRFARGGWTRS
jgi:hypothetical protein